MLRHYLKRTLFMMYSDHHALKWLVNLKEGTGSLARRRLRLAEFDYEISYIKGIRNKNSDVLSKRPTLAGTQVELDDEIPCYYCEEGCDSGSSDSKIIYLDLFKPAQAQGHPILPIMVALSVTRLRTRVTTAHAERYSRL